MKPISYFGKLMRPVNSLLNVTEFFMPSFLYKIAILTGSNQTVSIASLFDICIPFKYYFDNEWLNKPSYSLLVLLIN